MPQMMPLNWFTPLLFMMIVIMSLMIYNNFK